VSMDEGSVVASLRDQHDEVQRTLDRVAELHGPAREDLFLQARRLLAAHEGLVRLLLATDDGAGPSLAAEVAAAEELDHESGDFDEALDRVRAAVRRRSRLLPALLDGAGDLSEEDCIRVAAAVRLGRNEGDAYLGNSYTDMLAAAEEHLSQPAPELAQHPD